MFSDKIKARLAGLFLAGSVFAMPAALAAGVVVQATGPSADRYSVGTQLPDDSSITLRAGDRITVLVEGGTRVMQGPGTFRVGEGATRTRARFSQLTRRGAQSRARTGAVRDAGGPRLVPSIWYVNVASQPGNLCLTNLDQVMLWRPDDATRQTFRIVDAQTQASVEAVFVQGEDDRVLDPELLRLVPGRTYTITEVSSDQETAPEPVSITIAEVTGDISRPDMLAMALAENGCTAQLTRLGVTAEAEAGSL